MKIKYAVIKMNKGSINGNLYDKDNIKILFKTDTIFDTEDKAIEYITSINEIEVLIIQKVYITNN